MNLELNDELDDFELAPPTYEVWAIGYTAGNNESVAEQMLTRVEDPDEAVTFIDSLTAVDILTYGISTASPIDRFVLEVETAVGDDAASAGVIYRKSLTVDIKDYIDVSVDVESITFTEEGQVVLKMQYPVGTILRVNFYEPTTRARTCTIIYKVVKADANKIICDSVENF